MFRNVCRNLFFFPVLISNSFLTSLKNPLSTKTKQSSILNKFPKNIKHPATTKITGEYRHSPKTANIISFIVFINLLVYHFVTSSVLTSFPSKATFSIDFLSISAFFRELSTTCSTLFIMLEIQKKTHLATP